MAVERDDSVNIKYDSFVQACDILRNEASVANDVVMEKYHTMTADQKLGYTLELKSPSIAECISGAKAIEEFLTS